MSACCPAVDGTVSHLNGVVAGKCGVKVDDLFFQCGGACYYLENGARLIKLGDSLVFPLLFTKLGVFFVVAFLIVGIFFLVLFKGQLIFFE